MSWRGHVRVSPSHPGDGHCSQRRSAPGCIGGITIMSNEAEQIQRWLDAYTHAWLTYEPDEISALFTDDAEYRWHPWDEGDNVARGRAQIVAAWLENRDQAGTYGGA